MAQGSELAPGYWPLAAGPPAEGLLATAGDGCCVVCAAAGAPCCTGEICWVAASPWGPAGAGCPGGGDGVPAAGVPGTGVPGGGVAGGGVPGVGVPGGGVSGTGAPSRESSGPGDDSGEPDGADGADAAGTGGGAGGESAGGGAVGAGDAGLAGAPGGGSPGVIFRSLAVASDRTALRAAPPLWSSASALASALALALALAAGGSSCGEAGGTRSACAVSSVSPWPGDRPTPSCSVLTAISSGTRQSHWSTHPRTSVQSAFPMARQDGVSHVCSKGGATLSEECEVVRGVVGSDKQGRANRTRRQPVADRPPGTPPYGPQPSDSVPPAAPRGPTAPQPTRLAPVALPRRLNGGPGVTR